MTRVYYLQERSRRVLIVHRGRTNIRTSRKNVEDNNYAGATTI
jgi:hypothetical protein